jgi:hypothetical protein
MALKAEISECRTAEEKLRSLAQEEMEKSIQAARLKYERTLLEDVAPVKAEGDMKECVLNVMRGTVVRKELVDAIIRNWAKMKKANPHGWKEGVCSGIDELRDAIISNLAKDKKANPHGWKEEIDSDQSFYGRLSICIKVLTGDMEHKRKGVEMKPEDIRKAIQREFELLR